MVRRTKIDHECNRLRLDLVDHSCASLVIRPQMNGQWIGRYDGSRRGQVIVNVDERQSFFEGIASIIDDDRAAPNALAFFKTKTKARNFRFRADIVPVNPQTGLVAAWDTVARFYPAGTPISQSADVRGAWTRDTLKLSWKTDINLTGKATLPRSKANAPSQLLPVEKSWSAFKEYVAELEGDHFLFRGQN